MELKDKLQLLRKQNGYSQEQLADKLGIARQTLSKWENGQAVPELSNLISLSNLYGITIDRIVKEDDECNLSLCKNASMDINKIIEFILVAKKNTYAAASNKIHAEKIHMIIVMKIKMDLSILIHILVENVLSVRKWYGYMRILCGA